MKTANILHVVHFTVSFIVINVCTGVRNLRKSYLSTGNQTLY